MAEVIKKELSVPRQPVKPAIDPIDGRLAFSRPAGGSSTIPRAVVFVFPVQPETRNHVVVRKRTGVQKKCKQPLTRKKPQNRARSYIAMGSARSQTAKP